MKKNTKIAVAVLSVIMAVCVAVCVVTSVKLYDALNLEKIYEEYTDVIEEAQQYSQNSTENAEKLYLAILSNESITTKEKKELEAYIQYFVDNKYIDCEHVCNKLSAFTITENDPSLLDMGISAEYKPENSITFATEEDRAFSLSHEIHHCIENENLDYEYYGWFGEGFTGLVNYEYFDHLADNFNIQTFFVRGLCEIVGAEVLFEVSATGDATILDNALMQCGVDEEKIQEAFTLFTELKDKESYNGVVTAEEKFEAVWLLLDMYNIANNYPENITASFCGAIDSMFFEEELDYYYINSAKRDVSDAYQGYVPQSNIDVTYQIIVNDAQGLSD